MSSRARFNVAKLQKKNHNVHYCPQNVHESEQNILKIYFGEHFLILFNSDVHYCPWHRIFEFCTFAFKKKKMKTIEEKIGMAIMVRRRQQMVSQEDFARKAGITRSYMSSIENGKRVVSVSIIQKCAKTLGISMSELFRGID